MNQNMHMIRHHAPSEQFVVFVMKMKHGVLAIWAIRGSRNDTRRCTIKDILQFFALLPVVFNLKQMSIRCDVSRHGIGKAK